MASSTTDRTGRAFTALARHHAAMGGFSLRAAFARDPRRFEAFSATDADMLLDWSKCAVDRRAMMLLLSLARAASLETRRDAMFGGAAINATEARAVLHTALRAAPTATIMAGGRNVMPDVARVLARMARFARGIRQGTITGITGKRFTDVVNIGIGGSDLGPAMATQALAPYRDGPRIHFVSNVDGAHIADTLADLDPDTTLFLVASKTFTTIETMTNAATARRWIAGKLGEAAVRQHFAAISTATDRIREFGIEPERSFGFWDWVGGRYSVWSAIGLSLMIGIGASNFRRFLEGGRAMDDHFRQRPLESNFPVILGLIGIWHRNICGYGSRAIIPYDQRLARLPAYLQQLDMESNGKGVTADGLPVARATGPVVWGEPGTNGQHAFFQLLHQGTDIVPVEFLLGARPHEKLPGDHQVLLAANCFAQSQALMRGRTLAEAKQLIGSDAAQAHLAAHRVFPGNRPSITLMYRTLNPHTLGRIVALYEHRVFVEAAVWNINAFDQWGVELGKELASSLLPAVKGDRPVKNIDPSTAGLLSHYRRLQGRTASRPAGRNGKNSAR